MCGLWWLLEGMLVFFWVLLLVQTVQASFLSQNNPPLTGDDTGYYWIDDRPETAVSFDKNEYHNKYSVNTESNPTKNCVVYIRRIRDIQITEFRSKEGRPRNYYMNNFLPEKTNAPDWGLNIEIDNFKHYEDLKTYSPCADRTFGRIEANEKCPNCMFAPVPVTMFVDTDYELSRWKSIFGMRCVISKVAPCSTGTCYNGNYASEYITRHNNIINNRPLCKPCPPGTWLTCKSQLTCSWTIPADGEIGGYGSQVYTTDTVPVGTCFPCGIANKYVHYAGTANEYIPLPGNDWICPGGDSPPQVCPKNTQSNRPSPGRLSMVVCECLAGHYRSAQKDGDCVKCEKGHICVNGVKTQCPMHFHQPEEGQTQCIPCTSTGDRFGQGSAQCNSGELQQWCDTSIIATQSRYLGFNCVPCTQCRRPYLGNATNSAGTVNCYRG